MARVGPQLLREKKWSEQEYHINYYYKLIFSDKQLSQSVQTANRINRTNVAAEHTVHAEKYLVPDHFSAVVYWVCWRQLRPVCQRMFRNRWR
jgi:uncharacterized metal-binding protein YceD (DUF177 family)